MLNNLQNLRALAAYSVVIYHCLVRFLDPQGQARSFLDLPSGGVDLFFVISGFVMVHTTRSDESPAWFMTKRIARIVPLYWAATLFVAALVAFRPWIFSTADAAPGSLFSSLFFVPHADLAGHAYPVLGVGWTLNYEMMFYLLFALSMFLPHAMRLAGVVMLITAVWVSGLLGGDGLAARFYANPIMFEFAAGCMLAYALRTNAVAAFARAMPMWPLALAGFAGFFALAAVLPTDLPSIVRYGGPAFLMVFAAAAQDLHRAPAGESPISKLGDASYSAYLLHPIVIAGVGFTLTAAFGRSLPVDVAVLVIVPVIVAIVSRLSLRLLERPSGALVRGLLQKAGARPPRSREDVLTAGQVR